MLVVSAKPGRLLAPVIESVAHFLGYMVLGILAGVLVWVGCRITYLFVKGVLLWRHERQRVRDLLDHHDALLIGMETYELPKFGIDPAKTREENVLRFKEHLGEHLPPEVPLKVRYNLLLAFHHKWYSEALQEAWQEDLESMNPEDFRP